MKDRIKGLSNSEGQPHGEWEWYNKEGELIREITFNNGALVNTVCEYNTPHETEEGFYSIDDIQKVIKDPEAKIIKNGPWKKIDKNFNITIAHYKNGELDGPYKKIDKYDRVTDEGEFSGGKKRGRWSESRIVELEGEDDKMEEYIFNSLGYYDNGEKEGRWDYWSEEYGLEYEQFYQKGELRAERDMETCITSFHQRGYHEESSWGFLSNQVELEEFINNQDKLNEALNDPKMTKIELEQFRNASNKGKWDKWIEKRMDGTKKQEITYKDGKLHGESVEYDKKNNIVEKIEYKNDLKDGKETYYSYPEKGFKQYEIEYKEGKKHGIAKSFYKHTGVIKSITQYVNGKEHGLKKQFYPSGKLARETEYKNGIKSRYSKEYREKQNLKLVRKEQKKDRSRGR